MIAEKDMKNRWEDLRFDGVDELMKVAGRYKEKKFEDDVIEHEHCFREKERKYFAGQSPVSILHSLIFRPDPAVKRFVLCADHIKHFLSSLLLLDSTGLIL